MRLPLYLVIHEYAVEEQKIYLDQTRRRLRCACRLLLPSRVNGLGFEVTYILLSSVIFIFADITGSDVDVQHSWNNPTWPHLFINEVKKNIDPPTWVVGPRANNSTP